GIRHCARPAQPKQLPFRGAEEVILSACRQSDAHERHYLAASAVRPGAWSGQITNLGEMEMCYDIDQDREWGAIPGTDLQRANERRGRHLGRCLDDSPHCRCYI